jgi:hypothetical protein
MNIHKRDLIAFGLLTSVILLCLVIDSQAFTLSHYTRNAYNFEPLEYAHITVYNNDTNTSTDGFSDNDGLNSFTLSDGGNYTISAYKPGYSMKNTSFYINESETKVSYLTYDTADNVKFIFSDLTFQKHIWCFYYEDNNRLFGCFTENDTVLFPLNRNYTAYPKLSIFEQLGFAGSSISFLVQIALFIIGGLCLLLFMSFIIGVGMYMVKKAI